MHHGPIPGPIHDAQCIIECPVKSNRRHQRKGDEKWGGRSGTDVGNRRHGEGGVVCRNEGVKVERDGVGFDVAVLSLRLGDVFRAWSRFASARLRCIGFVVPSGRRRAGSAVGQLRWRR